MRKIITLLLMALLIPIITLATTIDEPTFNTTHEQIKVEWNVTGTNTTTDISVYYREVGEKDFILYFEEKNKELPYTYNHIITGLQEQTSYQLYLEASNQQEVLRSNNYVIETTTQPFSLNNLIDDNLILTLVTLLILILLAIFLINSWGLGGLITIMTSFIAFTHLNWLLGFIIIIIGVVMLFKVDE